MRRPFLALALAAAAACGEPSASSQCPTHAQPTMELGHGSHAFEPLVEGQDLMMTRGPQGGCHFALAFRTDGFTDVATIKYDVRKAETNEPTNSSTGFRVMFSPVASMPGKCEVSGYTAILDQPWKLEALRLRIDVALEDENGAKASASRTIVAVWPDPVGNLRRDQICGAH